MFKLFFHLRRCISYITFFLTRLLISISPLFCSKHNQNSLETKYINIKTYFEKIYLELLS